MAMASKFLRPASHASAVLIQSSGGGAEIKLQIRGYVERQSDFSTESEPDRYSPTGEIVQHLYATLKDSTNLVFANRKSDVESYTDKLRALCEAERMPQRFWAHHGSLSRQHREEIETLLKDKARPVTVVCTSTLELGIDIGAVNSIAQIGTPPSVASMRQRLGRSGRRGEAAVLRIYITESEIDGRSTIQDMLRVSLVQAIAMVELLKERWCEPSDAIAFDASTMLHQTLAIIAERSGTTPKQLWHLLCETGPFRSCPQRLFVDLLRSAREHELITQSADGTLLLDTVGERLVNHYGFYAVFLTADEFRLLNEGHLLGTIPVTFPVSEGSFLIFAGRRWRAVRVSEEDKVIEVVSAAAGRPPRWMGGGAQIHDEVRRRMFAVYKSTNSLPYLDTSASLLLSEARNSFSTFGLDRKRVYYDGTTAIIFPWAGDRIMHTMVFQLRAAGLAASYDGVTISVSNTSPEVIEPTMRHIAEADTADTMRLAESVENKIQEKYDRFLSDTVLCASYATRNLDAEGSRRKFREIAATDF
jgi:ATP-dependent Lhr-like helicase